MTLVNVYIPLASSFLQNYAPEFDSLLENFGDQMAFGDFNVHFPFWFFMTGDDRAVARGEVLVVNSSQVLVTNLDLPTHLLSQGQFSLPDVTLLNGLLLPDVIWFTHTTLGSDHLPISISPPGHVAHALPSPRKIWSDSNFCKANFESCTRLC